jgi:hypothetical protein
MSYNPREECLECQSYVCNHCQQCQACPLAGVNMQRNPVDNWYYCVECNIRVRKWAHHGDENCS